MKCNYCESAAIGFEESRYSYCYVERTNVCAKCAHIGAKVNRFDGTSYRVLSYRVLNERQMKLRGEFYGF